MALVVPQVPNIQGAAITYATPTTSETFVPGNNVYYHVKTVGTAITTTVVVPGSAYGQARPDVAISIGTNVDRLIGPLTPDLADSTGYVTITHSVTTAVTAAALIMGNG